MDRTALRSSFSVDWATQPFTRGLGASGEGSARRTGCCSSPPPWWFAGDWLSRATGWQHGAFESARAGVTALHQRALTAD